MATAEAAKTTPDPAEEGRRTAHLDGDDQAPPEPIEEKLEEPVAPESDEGGEPSGLPSTEQPSDDGDDDEPTVAEMRQKESLFDQERSRIGDSFAAKRREQLGISDNPESNEGPEGEGAAASPSAPDDDPPVTLKVNGSEITVRQSDVTRIAQESLAAGVNLHEAKESAARLLKEAESEAPKQDQPKGDERRAEATDPTDPAQPKPTVDPARLSAMVEKMQVGTPEEATEEFGSFLNEILAAQQAAQPNQAEPANVDEAVQRALSAQVERDNVQRAFNEFGQQYEPLTKDEDLTNAVFRQVSREILDDFRKIGMPEEDIAEAQKNPDLLLDGYRRLRGETNPKTGESWGLRDYRAILFESGNKVAKKFNVTLPEKPGAEPGKISIDPSRRAAKDSLTHQPRSAGTPANAGRLNGSQSSAGARERTRGSDIVAEQRRARGYPA